MVDLVLQYYYTSKTKRLFDFDAIRIIDIIIFGMSLLILANLQENMGPGKKYPTADPVVFNGAIHSLVNLFV